MNEQIYIASHDRDGGILRCVLRDGTLELLERYPLDRPAYLCREGNTLYALLREPFQMQSGIARFRIESGGALTQTSEPEPTHGTVAAHIMARHGRVYCANYLSGTVTLMPDRVLALNGRGSVSGRQDCSHPHCVTPTPDGDYVCINDLGTDRIYLCTNGLEPVSKLKMPCGSGPRHLVFAPGGELAYCSNELDSTVAVLRYSRAELSFVGAYSTIPANCQTSNSASAVRISPAGDRLYVSNRGHGSVCVFKTVGEELNPLGWYRVPGASLREFNLSGKYILCADETAGIISVFDTELGFEAEAVSRFPVSKPWCILPLNTNSR